MIKGTSPERGSLIVVDGPSGTGKDTLIERFLPEAYCAGVLVSYVIEERLDKNRDKILEARERGRKRGGTGDREMAEILVQHRAEIYIEFVEPAIRKGKLVVANRGESATLAYQTARGELTMDDVWSMHRRKDIRIPDAVILTSCHPETAVLREASDKQVSATRKNAEAGRGLSGKITVEKGGDETERMRRRGMIHGQYDMTARFLKSKGIPVLSLDTGGMGIEEEVETTINFLGLR